MIINDIEYTMLKKVNNNLFLSQEQMDILDEYGIDYKNKTLKELIFILDDMYNKTNDDVLINLLDILEERDYYENYNK